MRSSAGLNRDDLLHYIKMYLKNHDIMQDVDLISFNTDLVSYGIESIVLLTLLSSLEREFKVNINLDQLEKNCFVFSVNSLADASGS